MVFAEDKAFGKGYTLTDEGGYPSSDSFEIQNPLHRIFCGEDFLIVNIDLSIVHGIVILPWDEAAIMLTAFALLEGLQSLRKIHWQQ